MLDIHLKPQRDMQHTISLCIQAIQNRLYLHVISLNPENMMTAQKNAPFHALLNTQTQIIDGTGVLLASRWTGEYRPGWSRVTGVDLMHTLLTTLGKGEKSMHIALVGGQGGVANTIAAKYHKLYPCLQFSTFDDADPNDMHLASIITQAKPDLMFVAFGSPKQELWIDAHKDSFPHTVCIGVGGAFDMLSGRVKRAPHLFRSLGLEWLYRLITQPWRWRRQISLIKFLYKIA
jgi:N-acetylglucosaminyldiphosphoundecaprenol N-acetyl-beta-D-mannosaminyltransferase